MWKKKSVARRLALNGILALWIASRLICKLRRAIKTRTNLFNRSRDESDTTAILNNPQKGALVFCRLCAGSFDLNRNHAPVRKYSQYIADSFGRMPSGSPEFARHANRDGVVVVAPTEAIA